MPPPPANWVAAAVQITPHFETQGDPYQGVSGDFDGMGISCGALQWNIGKNSLQPMVVAVGRPVVLAAMPTIGAQMWTACTGGIGSGLTIVRSWQTGTRLRATPLAELRALMGTPQMRAEQDKRISGKAQTAFDRATAWAKEDGGAAPTKRLFCWFFDIVTQNGSLEGLTPAKMRAFIAASAPGKADDVICDFMAGIKGTSGHATDAAKNAALWRNQTDAEKLPILCMTYLRSKTADPRWQHVVINRKGTIAMGQGWVNGSKFSLAAQGL
ncbi:hypothetical protein [Sphingomonas hengshuiensis]|uniref:Peptidoglycan-binding protein n=1 Tax=Sphingomonas hengshuiensis TaxID=1609977 RepID=A0A7U4LED0_9SPHN|nr:hypothetical protein [Sphingomonas hengshuiensis]AJP71068.1 hypothetical protein TS85_03375 [Sphingomonas hengshuiensis]